MLSQLESTAIWNLVQHEKKEKKKQNLKVYSVYKLISVTILGSQDILFNRAIVDVVD